MKTNIRNILIAVLLAAATPAFGGPIQTLVHRTKDIVPASTQPEIAPVGYWTNFGRPSLTDDGYSIGFLASYFDFQVKGEAICHGPAGAPAVYVKKGDFVTDTAGTPSTTDTFYSFRDPVFGSSQYWATHARRKPGQAGIWAGIAKQHREVASVGVIPASIVDSRLPVGSEFLSFTNLQMVPGGTLYFTARVRVSGQTRRSLWRYLSNIPSPFNPPSLVIIEGETNNPYGLVTGPVSLLYALGDAMDITPSQGQMDALSGDIPIRYRVGTGPFFQVVATVNIGGTFTTQLASGLALGIPAGTPVNSPAFSGADLPTGGSVVTRVRLVPNTGLGITSMNSTRILDTNPLASYVEARQDLSPNFLGVRPGPQFTAFNSPVCGFTGAGTPLSISFGAAIMGAGGATPNIYSNFAPAGVMREVAARLGPAEGKIPNAQIGTHRAFQWLCHMDGKGPLFEGTYHPGTLPLRRGLWGGDPVTGNMVNLIQQGDVIANLGLPVATFQCLQPVLGSRGQRRAWVYDGPLPTNMLRPLIMKVTTTTHRGIVLVTF